MILGVSRRDAILAAFLSLVSACMFPACVQNTSPVGADLLAPNQRVVLHTLDSALPADSITMSARQLTVHVATGASSNLLLGVSGQIQSRVLLKFALSVDSTFLLSVLPARPLQSAYLLLKIGTYRYGDTSAAMNLAMTMNAVLTPYQSGATWDSLGALSNYGPVISTFTGRIGVRDTMVKIPIDTAYLTSLLSYRRFDSLSAHVNGLALLPQAGCSGIVSIRTTSAELHAVFKGDTAAADTVALSSIQHLYIADDAEPDPPGRMIVEGGTAKRPFLTVAFPKVPKLSTVNSAVLTLVPDYSAWRHGHDTFYQDSLHLSLSDSLYMYLASSDSALGAYRVVGRRDTITNNYVFPMLRDFIELWKHGTANFGMTMVQSINGVSDDVSMFDRFVFYPPTVADTTLRPRLKIIYSTLGN